MAEVADPSEGDPVCGLEGMYQYEKTDEASCSTVELRIIVEQGAYSDQNSTVYSSKSARSQNDESGTRVSVWTSSTCSQEKAYLCVIAILSLPLNINCFPLFPAIFASRLCAYVSVTCMFCSGEGAGGRSARLAVPVPAPGAAGLSSGKKGRWSRKHSRRKTSISSVEAVFAAIAEDARQKSKYQSKYKTMPDNCDEVLARIFLDFIV